MAGRLDRTAASALESVMADYNKNIMERYHLLVLDYGKAEENEKEALARWKTYFKKEADETMGNVLYWLLFDSEWFAMEGKEYQIKTTWSMLDQGGELFANQVAEYMKYKEVGNIVSMLLEQINIIQKGVDGQEALKTLEINKKEEEEVPENSEEISPLISRVNKENVVLLKTDLDVSSQKISEFGLPSRMQGITTEQPGKDPAWNNISEEVLIGEYILEQFPSYTNRKNCEGKMVCQQEYILYGNLSDKENMKDLTNWLLAVRCGLNLISILSSESMQGAVEAAAATISSVLVNPELTPVVQVILNCVWVYAESEHDVDALLKGEKVPFLKEEAQWIETLLPFEQDENTEGKVESVEEELKDSNVTNSVIGELKEIGTTEKKFYSIDMSYEDYIRIFLLFVDPKIKYYRMMDMIQIDMQKIYPKFKIANCICGMEAVVQVKGKEKFLMFVPESIKEKYELTRKVSFLY